MANTNTPPQQAFQHRFRVNPKQSYSERMTSTRADLRAFVREKLCEITGEANAQMRWSRASYMKDIVNRYRVRIEGWPLAEVPFKNLSDVPNLGKLELLFAHWRDGRTYFRTITETEYNEMVRDPAPWIGPENGGEPEGGDDAAQ